MNLRTRTAIARDPDGFERAVDLATEDAYSSPRKLLDAIYAIEDGNDTTPQQRQCALLVGEVLNSAMWYARTVHGTAGNRVDALAALIRHAHALENNEVFAAKLRAHAEVDVIRDIRRADFDE
ncbi:MAG: hypothetical protein KAX77_04885 [Xanthomonadales bacterium]|nr:hypothetical protein [Xanthomonadales bacterium]